MKITRLLKRQGLCVVAGVLLFAAIFGAYAMAQVDMPSQRAFDASADSMAELTRDPGNAHESDAQGIVTGPNEVGGGSVTVEPATPAPAVSAQPKATPAPQAAVTTPAAPQAQNIVGNVVQGVTGIVTDTLNCQYPTRPLLNGGCDNSDPCDPTTIKDPVLHGDCRN